MKTVQDAINSFRKGLADLYDRRETDAISSLALSEVTGFSKAKLKAFSESQLTAGQSEKLGKIVAELEAGQPIQYILGHTEFYGLKFEVDPTVLIPRPETEELVSWVIESVITREPYILDIGTGSGCIAISLKNEVKAAAVSAIDISKAAIQTAKKNAALNKCDVRFIEANILNADNLPFENKQDIIISNPPYVTETDRGQMQSNVKDFEPHTALFIPEDDPLIFYKAIADFAAKNLKPKGLLFFEINESYGLEVVELLISKLFINIELRRDIRGKDRMIKAFWH